MPARTRIDSSRSALDRGAGRSSHSAGGLLYRLFVRLGIHRDARDGNGRSRNDGRPGKDSGSRDAGDETARAGNANQGDLVQDPRVAPTAPAASNVIDPFASHDEHSGRKSVAGLGLGPLAKVLGRMFKHQDHHVSLDNWGYSKNDGPKQWSKIENIQIGTHQSPVRFARSDPLLQPRSEFVPDIRYHDHKGHGHQKHHASLTLVSNLGHACEDGHPDTPAQIAADEDSEDGPDCGVANTGRTVQIILPKPNHAHDDDEDPPTGGHLMFQGSRYDLVQIHFHAPSEHQIAGRRPSDLEAHFVHATQTGDLLVVGVFLLADPSSRGLLAGLKGLRVRMGSVDAGGPSRSSTVSQPPHRDSVARHHAHTVTGAPSLPPLPSNPDVETFLDGLLRHIPGSPFHRPSSGGGSTAQSHLRLNLTRASEVIRGMSGYYVYRGSLTTPPCKEGVIWVVGADEVVVGGEVLREIVRAMPRHNVRPAFSSEGYESPLSDKPPEIK
ncbi:hypothetical protein HK101_008275 [Irineochytrium annulatum]|nr:hypothetical protein HK101_008275 [Irineochytrium annulatum]